MTKIKSRIAIMNQNNTGVTGKTAGKNENFRETFITIQIEGFFNKNLIRT